MIHNPYWNKTVTVYNKREDNNGVLWLKHTFDGCFAKFTNYSGVSGNVLNNAENAIIRIPYSDGYLPADEWLSLENGFENYYTFMPDDIVVVDNITDEIDELTDGKRATDLIRKYAHKAVTVKSVNSDLDLPTKHFLLKG